MVNLQNNTLAFDRKKQLIHDYYKMINDPVAEIGIQPADLNTFFVWCEASSILYEPKNVKWSDESYSQPFDSPLGLCHVNSLRLMAILKYHLASGLAIKTSITNKREFPILHSFNLDYDNVIDYTWYKNRNAISLAENDDFSYPCEYIGVIISEGFISEVIDSFILPRFQTIFSDRMGGFVQLMVPFFYFVNNNDRWLEWIKNEFDRKRTVD